MSYSDSKQKLVRTAGAIITLLLLTNAYFIYAYFNSKAEVTAQKKENAEVEQLKDELEKQFYEAQKELDEMKTDNEQLNLVIEDQKNELAEQKNKISRMISSGKGNKRDLEAARAQLADMMAQRDQRIAEINRLKQDKEALTLRAEQLTVEKTELEEVVQSEKMLNQELTNVKATLVSQNEELEAKKLELSEKVNVASVVKVDDLEVTGWKLRKSGKAVNKKFAKNVDRLKVCFTAESNEVVASGDETFFVRVINPIGETMTMENSGDNIFKSVKTDEDIRYTFTKEFAYNNTEQQTCVDWEPGINFQKGEYQVEVYNKGHLAGLGSFKLK